MAVAASGRLHHTRRKLASRPGGDLGEVECENSYRRRSETSNLMAATPTNATPYAGFCNPWINEAAKYTPPASEIARYQVC
jgi:hypothetical protein